MKQCTWDKFRKERDFHKKQHEDVIKEKEALIGHTERLREQIKLYQPTVKQFKENHDKTTKDKMLLKLEVF